MEKIITEKISKVETKKVSLYQNIVYSVLSKMQKGYMVVSLPDNTIWEFGNKNSNEIKASVKINNYDFFKKVVLSGDIGFGESYVDGDWDADSVTDVISWMILNVDSNPQVSGTSKKFSPMNLMKIANKLLHKFNKNTISGSQKNISAHYDLSNDFYKTFLDETMTYSSGIFLSEDDSLYQSQINKYERICQELKINQNDHILEIGSGWGGFSIYAAENYNCKITTVTISKEQFRYAKELIEKKNLQDKINIMLKDYRLIEGQFDKVVSIEMIEAVGHEFLPEYFSVIDRVLKPQGSVAIQVISSLDKNYDQLRKGVDWIQKHIFPGSLLPSIAAMNNAVNKVSNLNMHSLENFAYDYAKTLKLWRINFFEKINEVKKLGFDDSFIRKWNYYLSYCEAAFAMKNINLYQLVYSRPNNRAL